MRTRHRIVAAGVDLEQARLELARIRTAATKPPDAAECHAEAQAVANPVR